MNELELIEKALTDAYTFVRDGEQTNETGDLLILLFKAKLLLKNCTISAVSGRSEQLVCPNCGASENNHRRVGEHANCGDCGYEWNWG